MLAKVSNQLSQIDLTPAALYRTHFSMKSVEILAQCDMWLQQNGSCRAACEQLKLELAKLGDTSPTPPTSDTRNTEASPKA